MTAMYYAIHRHTQEHRLAKGPDDPRYQHDHWLIATANADGWLHWRFGDRPISANARVDLLLPGGIIQYDAIASEADWRYEGSSAYYVHAYRPHRAIKPTSHHTELIGVPHGTPWQGDVWPPIGYQCKIVPVDKNSQADPRLGTLRYLSDTWLALEIATGEEVMMKKETWRILPHPTNEEMALDAMRSRLKESGFPLHAIPLDDDSLKAILEIGREYATQQAA